MRTPAHSCLRFADCATALLLYEYILTFLREVKYVWQRRLSGVMVVFLLNRYVVMSNRMVRLIQLKLWRGFTPQHAGYVSFLLRHDASLLIQELFSCKMPHRSLWSSYQAHAFHVAVTLHGDGARPVQS